MKRASIWQLVSVNACDDGMPNAEAFNCLGDMTRLVGIECRRLAFANSTETAMAGANIPKNHEGCGALTPAFEYVWTACLLTDGMEAQVIDNSIHAVESLICANAYLEPFR